MAKIGWGKILAGVATAAAAGAAYVYLKQRAARTPIYETLLSEGSFEIRRYPALLVIETAQHGTRDRALGNGFGLLADYMFGESREGDEIPITMPVLAGPLPDGAWRIRFLLPPGLDRDTLDPPGPGISIAEIPAREVAVIAVPGKPNDRLFATKANELRSWVGAKGRASAGDVEHGYYNSPLRPGTTLPNEVFVPLEA
ncbi:MULTISPECIES: SOUL family heme-binding protein [unclassified Sphingomonas]|uniref:SOUL family heme-binding protein n=1 Tax=unclassified Sphingomonas TaxID=196159 RepID=UPI0006F579B2|nr:MULTISPECIES: heme-binding protein [unclassified Sphingomonas]KQX25935.1 SOUL heme-binding protein [Sphingomonas sp. Root1294]KQY69000.1 SOUL heme-binding protein [Sphingomonas sp. Root50]KRB89256.1 SOUL heme-binding protein [Sphingomonas sp. Root720]